MNRPKAFLPKKIVAVVAAVSFAVSAAGLPLPNLPPVPNTVDSITPAELRMHLEFLASDELGGRYTLSPNFAIAARYLASHLEAYGFRGAGDHGSFLQTFEVIASKPDRDNSALTLTIGDKTSSYKFGDFYILGSNAPGNAAGPIVFVGAGISAPSQQHNDYAGLDVKGKLVLIAQGSTLPGIDPSRLTPSEQGEGAARAHGAAGVLQLPPQRFAELMRNKGFADRAGRREAVRLARDSDGKLPSITLGPELADKILAAAGLNLKAVYEGAAGKALAPKALGASARIDVAVQQTRATTQNVAGILEGSDPQLKNEYVVFSAHYDHLQTGADGRIFPGADDDGSGTTAVLSIARAMSLNRPRRSVLVIFHAGEELGLLGSEYNTDYAPAVPLDKMVVDLNIDMIGRSKAPNDGDRRDEHLTDAHTVYLVGSDRVSKELNEISEETNAQFEHLKLDYYYNDPSNPERIYFRSDHWNYAKHGVPIIFYFDGTHVDYHQPTDTVDKIDFTKLTDVARLVFETGWRIANLDHRLTKTQ